MQWKHKKKSRPNFGKQLEDSNLFIRKLLNSRLKGVNELYKTIIIPNNPVIKACKISPRFRNAAQIFLKIEQGFEAFRQTGSEHIGI